MRSKGLPVLHLSCALAAMLCLVLVGCAPASEPSQQSSVQQSSYTTLVQDFHTTDLGCGWEPTGSMELAYAQCFTVDYYEGGYALVCVADGNRYLLVPEGAEVPANLDSRIQVLRKPAQSIYLAASDTMCLFDALGQIDRISVSGLERDGWYVQAARDAMDASAMVYGGKYRSPDYELLVSRGVRLAIENTMINHTPEVREKLIEMGIPVLVELSSYESNPLGRAEWVRLYGALCDEDELAQSVFDGQVDQVRAISNASTGKTVAFFYLNANGAAVVRRPGEYVTKMIEMAGGTYAFEGLEAASVGSSSVTMEMEQFYAMAKEADVVIYNASTSDAVSSLAELVQRNELLADFEAVRSGNVWVCGENMYQQMISSGSVIADLNRVLVDGAETTTYFKKLT